MKVLDFISDIPILTAVDDRFFELQNRVEATVFTDEGKLCYTLLPGFKSNFRSGPGIVDCIVPHIGNKDVQICWLLHDVAYNADSDGNHILSKELADEILRQMLIRAGFNSWTARCVYGSVKLFGQSAYDEYDDVCKHNEGLYTFHWFA